MKVLILDPHGDDWISCAGTIKKHIDNRDRVVYVCFTLAEKSLPLGCTKDSYRNECKKSLLSIGVTEIDFAEYPIGEFNIHSDFPVRQFLKHRQEILDYLIKIRGEYQPDVVYVPSTHDIHQDHKVICNEGIRAFSKFSTIYGYDMTWNVLHSTIDYYIELSSDELSSKVKCASFYKSQLGKNNNSLSEAFLRSLAVVRGNKINVKYAEAFEVIISRG